MLHDPARLAALEAAGGLDPAPEPALDRLSALAREALRASAAYVMLVGPEHQLVAACEAADGPAAAGAGATLPLSHSLCAHALGADDALVIADAAGDPRWAAHPAVRELGVGAYLGVPVRTPDGHPLGTVCATEPGPRAWTAHDVLVLRGVAAAAEGALALRAAARRAAEREAQLGAIYDGASDMMFLMAVGAPEAPGGGRVYRCVSVNAAYRAVTGLSDAQLVGRRLEEIVPADHAEFLRGRYDAAVDGAEVLRYEERVALEAAEVHVETTLTPVRDGAGRCTHLLGAARDVTARRAGEEAVRASEARLRAMSAATPVGVFEADLEGRLRYVNPRACEIWEADEAAVLGDGWQERVHVHDLPDLAADWRAATEAGAEFSRVFRLLLPAGRGAPSVRWVHGRAAPLRDDAGRLAGSVGTLEDVTERHRAETTQRRLTSILEAMPDVVSIAAPSGRVEYLNAAGRRLLGVAGGADAVRAAGLLVRTVQPQFGPGGVHAAAVATAIAEGTWRGETTLRKPDGREVPVEQVILAHRGDDGDVEYLSSVLRDVTERKQAEATLRAFALLDDLTGLYNRRGFLALAEREWEAARAGGQGAVLAYLDLDGFKGVNDVYGHAEGDRALQAVAGVLRRAFRDADVVGRLGGDEFVAFARCGRGPDGAGGALENARATAERLQGRLRDALAEANATGARPYALATSVGVALFDPTAAPTLSALMVEADAALYDRKRARKRGAATPAAREPAAAGVAG